MNMAKFDITVNYRECSGCHTWQSKRNYVCPKCGAILLEVSMDEIQQETRKAARDESKRVFYAKYTEIVKSWNKNPITKEDFLNDPRVVNGPDAEYFKEGHRKVIYKIFRRAGYHWEKIPDAYFLSNTYLSLSD